VAGGRNVIHCRHKMRHNNYDCTYLYYVKWDIQCFIYPLMILYFYALCSFIWGNRHVSSITLNWKSPHPPRPLPHSLSLTLSLLLPLGIVTWLKYLICNIADTVNGLMNVNEWTPWKMMVLSDCKDVLLMIVNGQQSNFIISPPLYLCPFLLWALVRLL